MTEDFGSLSNSEDRERLERLFDDPQRGWAPFWAAFGETVKRGIRRFRFRPDDAADVLQEVTLHLVRDNFRFLRKWDPERGRIGAYLYVKTCSVCLDYIRKTREHLEEDQNVRDTGITPSEGAAHQELLKIFSRVLDQWSRDGLKPLDRSLIEGRLNQQEYSEIADRVGISEQNAMTRFSRLRKGLKKRLENAGIRKEDLDWEDWKKNL